jgi:hypothetical protein
MDNFKILAVAFEFLDVGNGKEAIPSVPQRNGEGFSS